MMKNKGTKHAKASTGKTKISIKIKIVALIVSSIVLTTGLIFSSCYTVVNEQTGNVTNHYMTDLVDSYGKLLNNYVNASGMSILTPKFMDAVLKDVSIQDAASSYAYLLKADGTILYHPDQTKIGQPIENEVVQDVVRRVSNGEDVETFNEEYEYKGVTKYASVYVNDAKSFILVITADYKDAFAAVRAITLRILIIGLAAILIFSAEAFYVAGRICKPIVWITEMIDKMANLDFRTDERQSKILKRQDETGIMAHSMGILAEKLSQVVVQISKQSEVLYEAADNLNSQATETAQTVEQVEKAVQDIADGANSQAEETQRATDNVILMGNMVEETNTEVDNLLENANMMKDLGDKATHTLDELDEINKKAKESIDIIYEQTNTTNESAMKIREATSLITSIAEETNLLSLNASIEAARAGEQGRGFAVVASQIQKLAEQSNESARQIESIIDSLIADSEKAVQTMDEVQNIMNEQSENVIKTGEVFTMVRNGIDSSIEGVHVIAGSTKKLDEARINVVDVVQNLTAIAEENAASTEETSASVTEVSAIVYNISDNSSKLKGIAVELEEGMKVFTLE